MTKPLALAAALAAAAAGQAYAQNNLPAPIEQQQLEELDAWSVSALSRTDGALARDLWAQSEPALLAQVFDKLPGVYESPAMQALTRRVLLSGGQAPRGESSEAARKRFEALGRMGAADDLATMAAGAGNAINDPAIAQYAAQAELARGRRAEACARGRRGANADTPPFLLRLRAYCAAVGGDRAAADLALEFAGGSGEDAAWFASAIAIAAGAGGARPPTARYDTSLNTALSLEAQLRPGPNALANSSTLALTALARNDATAQPLRAQAAALAFRRGAISASEARTILLTTPDEITSALPPIVTALRQLQALPRASASRALPGTPEADAAAAEAQAHALAEASAIADVLRQAQSPADFEAAARFFQTDIAQLQSAPNQAAAVLFARAAILSGDAQVARRLTASARQAGVEQATMAPLDAALAAMGGVRNERGTVAMHRRIDGGGASAARDVAILAALGAPVDGTVQRFVLANPPSGGARADIGAMLALGSAVERGATAEAALLAVAAAGEAGPARLDAESLERIIRALRGAGLEEDARRVAVEAILAGAPAQ